LYHEFGHIHEYYLNREIGWIKNNVLFDLTEEYYNQYEIYISETPKGIYYNKPIRL